MKKLNLILLLLCAILVTSSKPASWQNYQFYCTKMVKDIHPDASGVASVEQTDVYHPATLTQYKEDVYFAGSVGLSGVELWRTNGTAQGTVMVKNINPNGSSNPQQFCVANGLLFFTANDGIHGKELWKTDGTAQGTVLVKDVRPGPEGSLSRNMVSIGNLVLFGEEFDVSHKGLWRSDGSAAGTVKVNDTPPVYDIYDGTEVINGIYYYRTFNQIWRSDGSTKGTYMIYNQNGDYLTNVNGTLYFGADNKLYKLVGTVLAPQLVKSLPDWYPSFSVNYNGTLFFRASDPLRGFELWKSNGTAAGTVLVKDINPEGASTPFDFAVANGTLFFCAALGPYEHEDYELWKTNGTAVGTVKVKEINTLIGLPPFGGSSRPSYITTMGNHVYFSAQDMLHGRELWRSNGTAAGTKMVKDINPKGSSNPRRFLVFRDKLLFVATDGVNGSELYTYGVCP